jgi:glycosyltransferase involved in cell wall biosynthesis
MTGDASTRLVLLPSYNSGQQLRETVRAARRFWRPVWVVIDGSTDGSGAALIAAYEADPDPDLRILVLDRNRGKGAAILHGLKAAEPAGFTHVLTMDADGQHPASSIPAMMERSLRHPDAMILGRPVFDDSAPRIRVHGRKLSNAWTAVETLGGGIGDSLFGFRVYPIAELRAVMERSRWMRRFDFDPEAAVRLYWRGIRPINHPTPVRYLAAEEGGVSHFNYVRDNILLASMHARLVVEAFWRLPATRARRLRSSPR